MLTLSSQLELARTGFVLLEGRSVRHAVSLAVLFSLVIPAAAVPLPKGGSGQLGALSDKYLLDDADCIAVLNVRQVLASPAYQKALAGPLGEVLRNDQVAAILKDFGVDPLKDIDRICFLAGRSSQADNRPGHLAGFFLFEGRFDPAKVHAGAKKLAKTVLERGKAKVYELKLAPEPLFLAVLDRSHVVLAAKKEHVEDTLDKAAGKKKSGLKNKALAEMLAKIKPEESLSVIATGDMVVGGSSSSVNGQVTSRVVTLAESAGIQSLSVTANMKDEVHVSVTLTATSADKAREIEKFITDGIPQVVAMVGNNLPDLAKALKDAKIHRKNGSITIKGHGPGGAVQDLFVGWFTLRGQPEPKPKP
jgi:hypothetical protein